MGNAFGEAAFKIGDGDEALQFAVNTAKEGHVFAHILKHNVNDATRSVAHGVFEGDMLRHLDETWANRADEYLVARPDNRIQYDIPVDPSTEYVGGKPGADAGFPRATHMTIVTEADGVTLVTTYPIVKN